MLEATKEKVRLVVKDYISLFPTEYDLFKKSMKIKRDENINEFAGTKGDHALNRKITEYPNTLYTMLKMKLTDDEWKDFFDADDKGKSIGQRWFAKEFKEFRGGQRV